MVSKLFNRKWRIKPRIFTMQLLMLIVVFSCVFLAFNLFINSYTRSNVEAQLDDLTSNFGMPNDKRRDKPQNDFDLPDLTKQRKNNLGVRGEVIIVNSDYQIKEFNQNEDKEELNRITFYLQSKNIPLDGIRYLFIATEESAYYLSSSRDIERPDSFFVYYVSVTGINNLVDTVNFALIVIMAAAMVICFVIANIIAGSVTKPVRMLSEFAEEIGKGNFSRREFSFQDIEFDELSEAMNRSAEKLDLYDKDQHAFFQNVSHELRTPLMSIRCFAEGIECGLMDPQKSGATIIAETDRLSELVEDLLYISRIDNITSQIEKRENDLRDTLALCAENLKSVADKNGLRFEYQFDDDPVLFAYNEKHLYRAFINMISNALRYAKNTITLRCHQTQDIIEVSVIDDGAGIAPQDMPYIFERFYKGKDGKHGIGLSIVKSVVELHGGEITVHCDQGTCFSILFRKKDSNKKLSN